MLRIEVRDDIAAFDELAGWWNDLPGPRREVFLRSEWFRAMAASILRDEDQLQLWVVAAGEEPLAAIPLFRRKRGLRSLTELSTELFDVVHAGEPRAVDQLLSSLAARTYLRLEAVADDSPLARAVPRHRGWSTDHRTESAAIDLSIGLDQIRSQIGKSMRSNLNRGMRNLDEMGEVGMEAHPTPDRVEQVLAEGLALEAAGWKGQAHVAVRNCPFRTRFFTELAAVAEANDWLRLSALYLDGRMIAFNYDLEYAGRMTSILTAYDETLPRRSSPGHVLLWKTLEAASERGVTAYELGGVGGRNSWKLAWAQQLSPRIYITGFGDSLAGTMGRLAWRARRRLRALTPPSPSSSPAEPDR